MVKNYDEMRVLLADEFNKVRQVSTDMTENYPATGNEKDNLNFLLPHKFSHHASKIYMGLYEFFKGDKSKDEIISYCDFAVKELQFLEKLFKAVDVPLKSDECSKTLQSMKDKIALNLE